MRFSGWEPCYNFMSEWYEGLDTLHILQQAEKEKTGEFRGVSFFNNGESSTSELGESYGIFYLQFHQI